MSLLGTTLSRYRCAYNFPLQADALYKLTADERIKKDTIVWKKVILVATTWLGVFLAVVPQLTYIHYFDLQVRIRVM